MNLGVCRGLRALAADRRGNFSLVACIAALPLFASAALALDFSNFYRTVGAAQSSLDSAAFATAREYAEGEDDTYLAQFAQEFFDSNIPDRMTDRNLEVAFSTRTAVDGTEILTLTTEISQPTLLGPVIGQDFLTTSITSVVSFEKSTVEIAMVFDNSASMFERMPVLKEAAAEMVDDVFASFGRSPADEPVRFALVPFAATVNVGTKNKGAGWMDSKGWAPNHHEYLETPLQDAFSPIHSMDVGEHVAWQDSNDAWLSRFDLLTSQGTNWNGCVELRPWPHNVTDTAVDIADYTGNSITEYESGSLFVPNFNAGALMDNGFMFEGVGGTCPTRAILPLSARSATITNALSNMKPVPGYTNMQTGIVWGWRTLSPQQPFAEGRDFSDESNVKILLLVSDGANTASTNDGVLPTAYSAWGLPAAGRIDEGLGASDRPDLYKSLTNPTRVEKMNIHTLQACENARRSGVTIVAIAYEIPDSEAMAKELLSNCAGPPLAENRPTIFENHFFDAEDDAALKAAFELIADEMRSFRLYN